MNSQEEDDLDTIGQEKCANGLAAVCLESIPYQLGLCAGQDRRQVAASAKESRQVEGIFDNLEGHLG